MRIGVLTTLYGALSLEDALDRIASLGIDTVELGAGGYAGTAHCDAARLVADDTYAGRVRDALASRNLTLSAVSVHGNPLHPNSATARAHDAALRDGIEAAVRLGVDTVNCFSGCPGDRRSGGATPNWVTCPWPPEFAELWSWQWEEVGVPYWREVAAIAAGCGVRLALEMHPGMLVYNPETLRRLRAEVGSEIGANFDPSHLLWQGVDVSRAIRELGRVGAIHHVHAKDVAVDADNVASNGNLDPRPYGQVADRAWTFRTVGFGHGELFWKQFVSELRVAGYQGAISIEHEDMLVSVDEGLAQALAMLRRCVLVEPPSAPWWT